VAELVHARPVSLQEAKARRKRPGPEPESLSLVLLRRPTYPSRNFVTDSAYISGAVVIPSWACPGSTSMRAFGSAAASASVT
jgi:hypothetical protein